MSGDLAAALEDATADASADGLPAPVVLLSPACASFDQYPILRGGDHFREIAAEIGWGECVMNVFAGSDTSVRWPRWWWTVDRWTLTAVGALIAFGVIMALAASPAVGERIGLDDFYFARRQLVYLPVALALMIGASLLSPQGFPGSDDHPAILSLLVVATFVIGTEIKAARRWIGLGPISVQPSEFLKPAFAVVAAQFVRIGTDR